MVRAAALVTALAYVIAKSLTNCRNETSEINA